MNIEWPMNEWMNEWITYMYSLALVGWLWISRIWQQVDAGRTGCLWNNVWSSSRRCSCTRSSVRQLHRTLPTCVNPCQRVPRDAIFARLLTGILWSCDAEQQDIRKAKFSRVCSINLELTTDDRSRRFYFSEQFQWTFESWTVSQSLWNWLSAYVTVIC